jgi:hypothetical protein
MVIAKPDCRSLNGRAEAIVAEKNRNAIDGLQFGLEAICPTVY